MCFPFVETLYYFVILSLSLLASTLQGQSWSLLPNSPTAGFRHDDMWFINADTGWVVNVDGYIYKTTDGGTTWITQLFQPQTSFRCVRFVNSLRGWVGNLGTGSWSPTTDFNPLYETFDGGANWQVVTKIAGPRPWGLCGMSAPTDSVVYAVGRVRGPCYIMKTTDAGGTWRSKVFSDVSWLIDCHFFSADTGIIVGAEDTVTVPRYVVFYTTDGGESWQKVHSTASYHGTCWKIMFTDRLNGFISIQAQADMPNVPILKTTDGGKTWAEKICHPSYRFHQGIGFIDPLTGWCGHKAGEVKETTDGGETWRDVPFVANFNRFRKINDSVAYASGNRIWKYSKQALTVHQELPEGFALAQNIPNPFSGKTKIGYRIPYAGDVVLNVYDLAGRPVRTMVHATQDAGSYEVELELPYLYDETFFYALTFDRYQLTKKMMLKEP